MKTERIGTILERVMGGVRTPVRATGEPDWDVIWNRVAGDRVRAHSYVARIERGAVVVKVDGSAWLFDLTIRKAELTRLLEQESGKKVKKLIFVI